MKIYVASSHGKPPSPALSPPEVMSLCPKHRYIQLKNPEKILILHPLHLKVWLFTRFPSYYSHLPIYQYIYEHTRWKQTPKSTALRTQIGELFKLYNYVVSEWLLHHRGLQPSYWILLPPLWSVVDHQPNATFYLAHQRLFQKLPP